MRMVAPRFSGFEVSQQCLLVNLSVTRVTSVVLASGFEGQDTCVRLQPWKEDPSLHVGEYDPFHAKKNPQQKKTENRFGGLRTFLCLLPRCLLLSIASHHHRSNNPSKNGPKHHPYVSAGAVHLKSGNHRGHRRFVHFAAGTPTAQLHFPVSHACATFRSLG